MFHSVPAGGDAYVLSAVIHDWSDPEAIQILRRYREALSGEGKLVVIENVVTPHDAPDFSATFWNAAWEDLQMLVLLTGCERTEAEFRDLCAAAGFALTRVIPASGVAIIEGIAV